VQCRKQKQAAHKQQNANANGKLQTTNTQKPKQKPWTVNWVEAEKGPLVV
jgi:hypothetical protein